MYNLSLLLSVIAQPGLPVDVQQFNSIPTLLTHEQVIHYQLISKEHDKKTKILDITLCYNGVAAQAHRFFYVKNKNQWEIKS